MEYIITTLGGLGKVLQGCRKSKKLNQKIVSESSGLLAKTISKLENNPGQTQTKSLFNLLSSLDLEIILKDKNSKLTNESEW
jgi:HTH-type transcriptional regulator / antitoxin HipB